MKASKNPRQSRILQIVRTQNIGTQEDLVRALGEIGLDVTQATVSRDIKELGIIKVVTATGEQKYVQMKQSGEGSSGRLMKVFIEAVISIEETGGFVVVKTLPGMAQAAAAALDSMHLDEMIGSIAGDDTIFVATHNKTKAKHLRNRLGYISNIDMKDEKRPFDPETGRYLDEVDTPETDDDEE